MSEEVAPLSAAEKRRVLRQIQTALCHTEHPSLRACGLTEEEAQAVACEAPPEQVVDLFVVADEGPILDRCRIDKISDTGLGLLSKEEAEEHPETPFWRRIRQETVKLLWENAAKAVSFLLGVAAKTAWDDRWLHHLAHKLKALIGL